LFYASQTSKALRFGDILRGFFSTTPVVKEPPFSLLKKYSIEVNLPEYYALMDPCCQIRNQCIFLTPLMPIQNSFFENPFLAEDLTRINRTMKPQQSVPPLVWEGFSEEERQKRLQVGDRYAFVNLFVYEQNNHLTKYPYKKGREQAETSYYMIDFRSSHRVNCDKIISPERAPLELKVLELSSTTRQDLSDKVTSYYAIEQEEIDEE
jgi:hypothetical protein